MGRAARPKLIKASRRSSLCRHPAVGEMAARPKPEPLSRTSVGHGHGRGGVGVETTLPRPNMIMNRKKSGGPKRHRGMGKSAAEQSDSILPCDARPRFLGGDHDHV